ncbi:MAG: hypothetical protein ACE5KM_21820 [Planctomycetaceae bacterium]
MPVVTATRIERRHCVNYFAHGISLLDQPYVLAGAAVPDWLSVADRKVRMRPRRVEPFLDHRDPIQSAVAAGVTRHHADDGWFHRTRAFYEVSGELTRRIQAVLGTGDGFRCSFLGHIIAELLLDAALIVRRPGQLDTYYSVLRSLDAHAVQSAVNAMAKQPTQRLATFIDIFLQEEFLRDYLEDDRLLYRLNQVMRRVRLKPLPADLLRVLCWGRELVGGRVDELLAGGVID